MAHVSLDTDPVLTFPTIYIISPTGVPLDVLTGVSDASAVVTRCRAAFDKIESVPSPTVAQPATPAANTTTQQQQPTIHPTDITPPPSTGPASQSSPSSLEQRAAEYETKPLFLLFVIYVHNE